jgi:hypothetical protein
MLLNLGMALRKVGLLYKPRPPVLVFGYSRDEDVVRSAVETETAVDFARSAARKIITGRQDVYHFVD